MKKSYFAVCLFILLSACAVNNGQRGPITKSKNDMPDNYNALPIVTVAPIYPSLAAVNNISGHVIVEFTINVDGTVKDIEIVESEPLGVFDKAVRKAVEKWKFTPIVENDRPVILTNVQTKLTFNLAK